MRSPASDPQAPPAGRLRRSAAATPWRLTPWSLAVLASTAVVVLVVLAIGISWLASLHTSTATSSFASPLRQVILRLGAADVTIVGSSSATLELRRTEHYAFGHPPRERRVAEDGVLRVYSSCPRVLVGTCSASYELAVPETAALDVRTTSGNVRLEGFRGTASVRTRSGDFVADAYCGFGLTGASASGDLHVSAACAPAHLQLRTGSGDAVALVPPGRYRIEAHGAPSRVAGLTSDPNAPFSIEATSSSGSVTVGGGL